MQTAKEWMQFYDPAWGDCSGRPELTEEAIVQIQSDTLEHAAKIAMLVGDSIGQINPNSSELSDSEAMRQSGAYQVQERLLLELRTKWTNLVRKADSDKTCDCCAHQEGRHYCSVWSQGMKNMDSLVCPEWREKP